MSDTQIRYISQPIMTAKREEMRSEGVQLTALRGLGSRWSDVERQGDL